MFNHENFLLNQYYDELARQAGFANAEEFERNMFKTNPEQCKKCPEYEYCKKLFEEE